MKTAFKKEKFQLRGNRYYAIGIALSIFAGMVGIRGLYTPIEGVYKYVCLLPILYAILNMVFIKVYRNVTLSVTIVLVFMFIRYVVSVLVLQIEKFPRGIYYIKSSNNVSFLTALLMGYEMLVIFWALSHLPQIENKLSDEEYVGRLLRKENFSKLNIISICIVMVTVLLHIIYPSLLSNFSLIIGDQVEGMVQNSVALQSNLPGGMRWIGYMGGIISRYIILEWIVIRCFLKSLRRNKMFYWWMSIIVVGANMLITTSMQMVGIFFSLVLFYQIYRLYPKQRKLLFGMGVVIGCTFFGIILFTYWSTSLTYHSLSQMIQGYTNGFYNVYQSQFAYDMGQQSLVEKLEMFIVGDGLGSVNIVNRWINGVASTQIYNAYIYGNASSNGGAIIPLVAQCSYYFTIFLGPLISGVSIFLMRKFETRSYNANGSILLNSFASLIFAVTPFMYNYSITIHIVTIMIIPIWFVSRMNKIEIKI